MKNEKEICELVEISVFKEHKQYILDLSDTIQKTDFSVLANVSNEKIRGEKSKMYKTIVNKCKWRKQYLLLELLKELEKK